MKTQDLVNYYGTKTAVGAVLGITRQAVVIWGQYPPPIHQLLFERLTRGLYKAEPGVWQDLFPNVQHELVRGKRTRRPQTAADRRAERSAAV